MPEPLEVVTTTFTTAAACAGVTQVIVVGLITVTFVAAAPPMLTLVAPLMNSLPVIVTGVPPATRPLLGLMLVTETPNGVTGALAAEAVESPAPLVATTVKV